MKYPGVWNPVCSAMSATERAVSFISSQARFILIVSVFAGLVENERTVLVQSGLFRNICSLIIYRMHFWSPQGTWNCLSVSCLLFTWYPVCAPCGRHQLLHRTMQDHWRCRSKVYGLCEPRFGHFVQLRLAVFICKSLNANAMKRITSKFCVLRPHKDGSGKNNFQ